MRVFTGGSRLLRPSAKNLLCPWLVYFAWYFMSRKKCHGRRSLDMPRSPSTATATPKVPKIAVSMVRYDITRPRLPRHARNSVAHSSSAATPRRASSAAFITAL